jgi:hypothetical protein
LELPVEGRFLLLHVSPQSQLEKEMEKKKRVAAAAFFSATKSSSTTQQTVSSRRFAWPVK